MGQDKGRLQGTLEAPASPDDHKLGLRVGWQGEKQEEGREEVGWQGEKRGEGRGEGGGNQKDFNKKCLARLSPWEKQQDYWTD